MNCQSLKHPFQNDPGASQHQRVMHELLQGAAAIDGRTLADLLDYFVQLSQHINYYDTQLNIKNWQPFFRSSAPFIIASIIRYNRTATENKLAAFKKAFVKKPSKAGLQLLLNYVNNQLINKINEWQSKLQDATLPVKVTLGSLIKNTLTDTVRQFMLYNNAAVKWYCVKPQIFNQVLDNETWELDITDAYANFTSEAFSAKGKTKRKRLLALYKDVEQLVPAFLDAIRIISGSAEQSLQQSLFPLQEDLQEKHHPHLALLFSFLKLFTHLQTDLNSFSKKHLDFFYKKVLKLQPQEAVPDKAHVVFEIQHQLNAYLLKKGLQLKDGKDLNKQEILFATDREIVVNKAQVADIRTLFLNNHTVSTTTWLEGVYMAPDARKANGIDKEFKEEPNSWPTPGARYSKYTDPENKFIHPYPNARIAFILASPVLLLNEGTRKVTITLSCLLKNNYCSGLQPVTGVSNSCCDPGSTTGGGTANSGSYNSLVPADTLYNEVRALLGQSFYYLNRSILAAIVKKGIGKDLNDRLNQLLTIRYIKSEADRRDASDRLDTDICYCAREEKIFETTITKTQFESKFNEAERMILAEFLQPRKALTVSFSGEKEWIMPETPPVITMAPGAMVPSGTDKPFTLTITAELQAHQKAVTFYNAANLKEELSTTLPVVKIELDDKIKLFETITATAIKEQCCERKPEEREQPVSLYHFFRNVIVAGDNLSKIETTVCGLKNFIVQNDESLQNVNAPVYPFGTRPVVIDFDVTNPPPVPVPDPVPKLNLVGPNFYIGSQEVFGKKWNEVYVNINWKDKPTDFNKHYKGYLVRENYHNCEDPENNDKSIYGLNECDFQMNLALLENGNWIKEKTGTPFTTTVLNEFTKDNNRQLFEQGISSVTCHPVVLEDPDDPTSAIPPFDQTIKLFHDASLASAPQFDLTQSFNITGEPLHPFGVNSRNNFLRINLQNQDFLHKNYSYVLARQMMAFGRYPDLINGAVYDDENAIPSVFDISIFFGNIGPRVIQVAGQVVNSAIEDVLLDLISVVESKIDEGVNVPFLNNVIADCKTVLDNIAGIASLSITDLFNNDFETGDLTASEQDNVNAEVRAFFTSLFTLLNTDLTGVADDLKGIIRSKFNDILDDIDLGDFFSGSFGEKTVVIPNEPWTPVIKEMSIDYKATAAITDIDLIHLYPYTGTYKTEELETQPSLFPTFCDEGNLHLGLKDLQPGSNLNILFQLAEATADSESQKEDIQWYYLENNTWKLLRTGFEVLEDATEGLTTSGIIRFALPGNMTSENTVLPKGLHWIKAAIPINSRSVAETIGIFTQAVRATFTNYEANDKQRLDETLPAASLTKLKVADTAVKKITQPYETFGGRVPEETGQYYVRVSELLRHKGRAIQKFDYERLVLDAFPQVFKAKCINHSFALDAHKYRNDHPVAPGYVLLAVIPDMNKLRAMQQFEPRVPVSMLESIQQYIAKKTSPFVRLRVMNPRYEKVQFCLRVKLYIGKDEHFYKEKLQEDLREFLAPWAVGVYDKLTFGQCINRSDIIRFLESRDYLDYIIELKMRHEDDETNAAPIDQAEVCPVTPRSILIAGDIDVCIQQQDCETWHPQLACANQPMMINTICK